MSELESPTARPMSRNSFRIAAAAAVALGPLRAFLLWLLPRLYDAPDGLEAAVALHQNPFYLSRLWCQLRTHLSGPGCIRCDSSPALAPFPLAGGLRLHFLFVVGLCRAEAGVSRRNIFAVNADWRAHFALRNARRGRVNLRVLLIGFGAVWDALFFLLLTGFLLGTSLFRSVLHWQAADSSAGLGSCSCCGTVDIAIHARRLCGSHVSWIPLPRGCTQCCSHSAGPFLPLWLWQAGADNSLQPNVLHGSASGRRQA
jgi:hypothetical protein